MKNTARIFLWIALAVGGGSACNSVRQNPGPEGMGGLRVQISQPVADRTTDFAFDFLKALAKSQPTEGNIFVSPLSLHLALGMLINGAEGTTAEELRKVLKMEGISQEELNEAYQTLAANLPLADPKVTLAIANSVWYRKGLQVEPNFVQAMNKTFKAQVTSEDFSNPATVKKINSWASDHTNGKIKKVLDNISPQHVMFLMNALYFKGDWKYQFDAKKTADAPFYLSEGSSKNVKMMELSANLGAFSNGQYTAVELPYGNGQYNLTLVMPDKGHINELIGKFGKSEWDQLQTNLQNKSTIKVKLPKFALDYEINLNGTLQAMGMSKAFTESAEFGGISRLQNLLVSFVKQNTYLGVDEKGTEAAAVTTIGMVFTSIPAEPKNIVFNKPFLFFISEKSSNTVQFVGRITNP